MEREKPKAVLRYPERINFFDAIQAWEQLGFTAGYKGEGAVEVTEANGKSLKDFLTSEMVDRIKCLGVGVELSWK